MSEKLRKLISDNCKCFKILDEKLFIEKSIGFIDNSTVRIYADTSLLRNIPDWRTADKVSVVYDIDTKHLFVDVEDVFGTKTIDIPSTIEWLNEYNCKEYEQHKLTTEKFKIYIEKKAMERLRAIIDIRKGILISDKIIGDTYIQLRRIDNSMKWFVVKDYTNKVSKEIKFADLFDCRQVYIG